MDEKRSIEEILPREMSNREYLNILQERKRINVDLQKRINILQAENQESEIYQILFLKLEDIDKEIQTGINYFENMDRLND